MKRSATVEEFFNKIKKGVEIYQLSADLLKAPFGSKLRATENKPFLWKILTSSKIFYMSTYFCLHIVI